MKYTFTLICKEKDHQELVRADHVDSHFKCPNCGLGIAYVPTSRTIGIHGRTKETIRHELRQATELNDK